MAYFNPELTNEDCRRRGGRLAQESLSCSLGKVVEMSATGMSVVTRKRPAQELEVSIHSHIGTLTVKCKLVRLAPEGLFTYRVGFQFIDLDDQSRSIITRIARLHRERRTM